MFLQFGYICKTEPRFRVSNCKKHTDDRTNTLYWICEYETYYIIHRINEKRMKKWEDV